MHNKAAFLYPSDPLNPRSIDEAYHNEYVAAKGAGLNVYLLDITNIGHARVIPVIENDWRIVYRGWMLTADQYAELEQRFGEQLLTSKQDYCNAHHFPLWYQDIKSLTIPSVITDEQSAQEQFKTFNGKAFIKDYVKSLKTGKGSIVDSCKDIDRAIYDMKRYRGFIEGGIVLREVIDLEKNSETRFFVVKDKIFSPVVDNHKYLVAQEAVEQLKNKNLTFYSIDVATINTGKNIIIEIGDGQVSDYVGWQLKDFVAVLKHLE